MSSHWSLQDCPVSVVLPSVPLLTLPQKLPAGPQAGPLRPPVILLAQSSLVLFGPGRSSFGARLASSPPAECPALLPGAPEHLWSGGQAQGHCPGWGPGGGRPGGPAAALSWPQGLVPERTKVRQGIVPKRENPKPPRVSVQGLRAGGRGAGEARPTAPFSAQPAPPPAPGLLHLLAHCPPPTGPQSRGADREGPGQACTCGAETRMWSGQGRRPGSLWGSTWPVGRTGLHWL